MPRRPAMPKSVKVGAHVYTVLRVTKAAMPDKLGECDFDGLVIRIRKGLKLSKAREVLKHEVNHACGYPSLNGKTLAEEKFVDTISPVQVQVLRDNPEYVAFLTA